MPSVTRRETFGLGLAGGLAVTFVSGGAKPADAAPAPAPTFTIVHVNDIYRMADVKGRGGFPKLAAVVKAERARGVPTLFTHGGDTLSPSLMSGFDKGAHIVTLTNMVKPDVFVPGNHEFDFGEAVYFERLKEANFPVYAANMTKADGSPIPGMKRSEIEELGGVKLGIVGLALEETPTMSQPGDLKFLPALEVLKTEAAALRAQGADLILAVAHAERALDDAIMRRRLVDILVTGHIHDLSIGYDGDVVHVESNEDANFVTAIDVAVTIKDDGKTRKVSWFPSFRIHDTTSVDPDPEVAAAVAVFEQQLSKDLDVDIGTTTTELDTRTSTVRSREAAFGDLVADAIRQSTGAEIAITNGGGIRADTIYPAGTVLTRRDIMTELPFGNTTVLVEISGADVRAALENGFSQMGTGAGRFPQVSGLELTVDPEKPAGSRVVSVKVGDAPLEADRLYKVASNNFMLAGGDGYKSLAEGKILIGATDGELLATVVMNYIAAAKTISPSGEGRIVIE